MQKRRHIWIGLFILMLLCMGGCGKLRERAKEIASVPLYTEDDITYFFKIGDGYFQKYNGEAFEKFYVTGMNIGSSKPNTFPGELGITEEEYEQWFEQIADMHINTIRVYTVMRPDFYDALYKYNTTHEEKIFLFQGCWYDEEVVYSTFDAFSDIENVKADLKNLVDIIHGKCRIAERRGHASGRYTKDISDYVLGWILGIESDRELVEGTRLAHPDTHSYQGEYLTCEDADPYEVFWCEIGDYVLQYENETYHYERPISYSNWPVADVMEHPNEPLVDEDSISLTVDHLRAGEKLKTGIFASYHVYSYYPTFMFVEEQYTNYIDGRGNYNTYLAYLKDLVAHHEYPVLVAEFGIPTSRGVTHVNPVTGYNQGGMTEKQQGEILISMFEDIEEAGCAGGIIFAWEDEWFKKTWNTTDYTNSDYRAYWNDIQTSESHYGILEFVSDDLPKKPALDGSLEDWDKNSLILDQNGVKLYAACDSTYVYVGLQDLTANFEDEGCNLYFDIKPDAGCDNYGKAQLSVDADFVLHIEGKQQTRLLADPASNPYIRAVEEWDEIDLHRDAEDAFQRIYMVIDRALYYPQTGVMEPVKLSEAGFLRYGKLDAEHMAGNAMTDFYYKGSVFEARIPWGVLGFSAPSWKEINDLDHHGVLRIKDMRLGYIAGDEEVGVGTFYWDDWDTAKYTERLKSSYYMLKEYLGKENE